MNKSKWDGVGPKPKVVPFENELVLEQVFYGTRPVPRNSFWWVLSETKRRVPHFGPFSRYIFHEPKKNPKSIETLMWKKVETLQRTKIRNRRIWKFGVRKRFTRAKTRQAKWFCVFLKPFRPCEASTIWIHSFPEIILVKNRIRTIVCLSAWKERKRLERTS